MRWITRALLVVLGAVVLVVGLERVASESGEVVVLTTTDAEGEPVETRLWIVDHEGSAWLRSGSSQSGWYQRLIANNAVTVARGESVARFVPEPEPKQRRFVNQLMRDKYGWADGYISALFSRSDAIPIRLVPAG